MRIALIHYRLLKNGGLETRLFNYLNEFRNRGFDITLIVSKIDPEVEIHPDINIEQVNLKMVPKPVRMYFFDNGVKRVISKGNFDFSFSLGRTSNQDLVLCPGNHLGYLKAMNLGFGSPIDRLNVYLDRKAYKKSRLVLACSQMMKDELIELFRVPKEKIEVLLPPIDSKRFNLSGKTRKLGLRSKHGFSADKKSLLFLTTGNERKGYPFLLKLMKEMIDEPVELIVAGVKPMNSSLPNVKYIGYTENSEELLWAADALIHPALYEPFGQVITESIQCGTPVLISEMVGAKEIVSDNIGQVVAGFDLETWKAAVIEALNREFQFEEDFAERNKFTIQQHCDAIISYAKSVI